MGWACQRNAQALSFPRKDASSVRLIGSIAFPRNRCPHPYIDNYDYYYYYKRTRHTRHGQVSPHQPSYRTLQLTEGWSGIRVYTILGFRVGLRVWGLGWDPIGTIYPYYLLTTSKTFLRNPARTETNQNPTTHEPLSKLLKGG